LGIRKYIIYHPALPIGRAPLLKGGEFKTNKFEILMTNSILKQHTKAKLCSFL